MPLLAPLALLGLLFVPLILAFYMLRLRRPERAVSSTFLWQQLVRDVEANAPWQRLRRSLLLLLQLLLAIALALVVARPFTERPAGLARDLVMIVDASASMAATDVFPSRLEAAKRAAVERLADLPSDGRVSVIEAGGTARLVANELGDRGRVARAIQSIQQSSASSSLADALTLADALAARAEGSGILVVTDDAASSAPRVEVSAPVEVLPVGRDRHNQAIAALAVRADPSGLKRSVFVSVANLDDTRVQRRLQVLADDVPFTARDIVLDPLTRAEVVIDELPPGTRVVEARLGSIEGPAASGTTAVLDQLAVDDVAWTIVPADRLQQILLVGPGNVYLQNALTLLPNVELYGATAETYGTTTGLDAFDLIVFDGFLPPELPPKPILAIAPPRTSALGAVQGTLEAPSIGQAAMDEPLLRNVDLSRIHVAEAQKIGLPTWARSVIPGPAGAPLLYSGLRDGLPTAVIAFDLRQSDLPLQVAWPVLAANLTGELLGIDPRATGSVDPGAPVEIPLLPESTGVRVTGPDGVATTLEPGGEEVGSVTFVLTGRPGVYRVEQVVPQGAATASPGSTPAPSPAPSPTPTADESAAPGGAEATAEDPSGLFAVNLFDEEESNIAPGDGARLVALGAEATEATAAASVSRDEWWVPLALLALVVLLLEWLVYERDGARRLAAALHLRRPAAPSSRRGAA